MSRLHLPAASTRVRLTAWYATLFVMVLLAVGISVEGLARNRLMADVDWRLESTAADIGSVVERNLTSRSFTASPTRFEDIVPTLGSFASRGLLIQITDPTGKVVRASEYAPAQPLIPLQDDLDAATQFTNATWNGDTVRAVNYPLMIMDASNIRWFLGTIIVAERLTTMNETLASLRQVLMVSSALGLALALAAGWAVAGRALRPVDRVTAAAARIARDGKTATSLAARLPIPPTNDELSRLSATFNAMLDRLEASFSAQERFVADASHELRTPLTAIRGNVDVLSRQALSRHRPLDSNDLLPALNDIRQETERMRRLLDDLLALARADAGSEQLGSTATVWQRVNLDQVAADAIRSAASLATGQILELEAPRPVAVDGDPDRLHQLLLILLDNAIRHTPAPGHIRVAVANTADGFARIGVRDDGEGIDEEHLPHLFKRFYRADGARGRASGGTGLGLAIARSICQLHGGDIAVSSAPGQGTTFIVSLPSAEVSAPSRVNAGTGNQPENALTA